MCGRLHRLGWSEAGPLHHSDARSRRQSTPKDWLARAPPRASHGVTARKGRHNGTLRDAQVRVVPCWIKPSRTLSSLRDAGEASTREPPNPGRVCARPSRRDGASKRPRCPRARCPLPDCPQHDSVCPKRSTAAVPQFAPCFASTVQPDLGECRSFMRRHLPSLCPAPKLLPVRSFQAHAVLLGRSGGPACTMTSLVRLRRFGEAETHTTRCHCSASAHMDLRKRTTSNSQ